MTSASTSLQPGGWQTSSGEELHGFNDPDLEAIFQILESSSGEEALFHESDREDEEDEEVVSHTWRTKAKAKGGGMSTSEAQAESATSRTEGTAGMSQNASSEVRSAWLSRWTGAVGDVQVWMRKALDPVLGRR